MELFTWDDSLNLNIEKIDVQHRGLFNLVNEYFDQLKTSQARQSVPQIVDKLVSYAVLHFQDEEQLFASSHYPEDEALAHFQEHESFLLQVQEYQNKLKQNQTHVDGKPITVHLWAFLKDWLVNHIQNTDMRYKTYINSPMKGNKPGKEDDL